MDGEKCRLCCAPLALISLTCGKSRKRRDYIRKLTEITTGIKFQKNDSYRYICVFCISTIYNFHVFKVKSLQNEKFLQSCIQSPLKPSKKMKVEIPDLCDIQLPSIENLKIELFDWLRAKINIEENEVEMNESIQNKSEKQNNINTDCYSTKSTQTDVATILKMVDEQTQIEGPGTYNVSCQYSVKTCDEKIQCLIPPVCYHKTSQTVRVTSRTECDVKEFACQCNLNEKVSVSIGIQSSSFCNEVLSKADSSNGSSGGIDSKCTLEPENQSNLFNLELKDTSKTGNNLHDILPVTSESVDNRFVEQDLSNIEKISESLAKQQSISRQKIRRSVGSKKIATRVSEMIDKHVKKSLKFETLVPSICNEVLSKADTSNGSRGGIDSSCTLEAGNQSKLFNLELIDTSKTGNNLQEIVPVSSESIDDRFIEQNMSNTEQIPESLVKQQSISRPKIRRGVGPKKYATRVSEMIDKNVIKSLEFETLVPTENNCDKNAPKDSLIGNMESNHAEVNIENSFTKTKRKRKNNASLDDTPSSKKVKPNKTLFLNRSLDQVERRGRSKKICMPLPISSIKTELPTNEDIDDVKIFKNESEIIETGHSEMKFESEDTQLVSQEISTAALLCEIDSILYPNAIKGEHDPVPPSTPTKQNFEKHNKSLSPSFKYDSPRSSKLLTVQDKVEFVKICKICDQTLYSDHERSKHRKFHMRCHLCQKAFRSIKQTRLHISLECGKKIPTLNPVVYLNRVEHFRK